MSHIRLRHKIIIVWFVTCEVSITNEISSPSWGVFLLVTDRLEAKLPWQFGLAHEKMPLMAFYQRKRRSFLSEFMMRQRINELRKRVPEATQVCCKKSPVGITNTNNRLSKACFFLKSSA